MAKQRLTIVCVLAVVILSAANLVSAAGQVATLHDLTIEGVVEGDVLTLAGNISLGENADVRGHVVAVFGSIERAPGAQVEGRTIAISSLATLTLEPVGGEEFPHLRLAIALLTAGAWLLTSTLLAFLLPARLRYGTLLLPRLSWRVMLIGLLSYITVLAALVAVLGLGPGLGVPLAISLALVFMAARAVGLAMLGGVIGTWLLDLLMLRTRIGHRQLPLTVPVFLGVLVLVLIRFIPVIGGVVWKLTSLASVGTGVFSVALTPTGETLRLPARS